MITLKNTQQSIKFNMEKFKKDAAYLLGVLNYSDYDLGIWLTDNKMMQQYNKKYRHKDKPTDILSFPFHTLKPGERIQANNNDDKNIGDIMISVEYVKKDAPNWGHTFDQRMSVLLVHGIYHLLGYDHETDEQYAQMKEQEDFLLEKLAKKK